MRKQAIHEHIEFAPDKEKEDAGTVTAQINMCNGLEAIQQSIDPYLWTFIFVIISPESSTL